LGGAANEPTLQPAVPDAGSDLQAELQAARAKATENYELYLRARADLENTRRRAMEDIAKTQKFAIESFAEALIPVFDSLERALESNVADPDKLREGVQITLKQLRAAFERARLTEINPAGQKFDPHRHQAISTVPISSGDPAAGPNQVVEVLQKGWMIADRVLRPALVTVTQGT
jgi:molecular chaperone GrpE